MQDSWFMNKKILVSLELSNLGWNLFFQSLEHQTNFCYFFQTFQKSSIFWYLVVFCKKKYYKINNPIEITILYCKLYTILIHTHKFLSSFYVSHKVLVETQNSGHMDENESDVSLLLGKMLFNYINALRMLL